MSDMTQVIVPKSDQLNADDLLGRTLTIKITKVNVLVSGDQRVSINYEGDNGKPYKPCKSMCRVLVKVWGNDSKNYVGKSMTLFCDEKVTWAGAAVGGIRISNMSHIKEPVTMALTATRANKKPYTVKPLILAQEPEVDAALKVSGDEAAKLGVESYTAWLATLTPEQKASIKHLHSDWTKIAKSVVTKEEGTI